ncbi:MAG: trypsin-like peptidase domain-containing protein [Thermoguttaceae bacterium]
MENADRFYVSSNDDWFYVSGDRELGPFSREQLQELLAGREIGPDTMVRKRTWMDWREAGTLDLPPATPAPAALSDAASSPPVDTDGQPVEPAAVLSAEKTRPPSPPPPPPKVRPRRMRVSRLAVALAAGTVVTMILLAAVLLPHHNGKEFAASASPAPKAIGRGRELPQVPVVARTSQQNQIPKGWEGVPQSSSQQPQRRAASSPSTSPKQAAAVDWEIEADKVLGPAPSSSPKNAGHAVGKTLDPVALYAKSRAAVATVLTKDDSGYDAYQGSGFFIPRELVGWRYQLHGLTQPDTSGKVKFAYLLTNYHVIRSAAAAKVRLGDGRSWSVYDVVLEREDMDLAVVTVSFWNPAQKSDIGMPVSTLDIAQGPEPPVGQKVYAIGSPKGLEASLSEGIISGRREVAEGIWHLQTTTPISPGSSGGPLLDSTGQVVGVTTAALRGGQNLNFAVPALQILTFLKGRCNSRELWRGSSIIREEWNAYFESQYHLEDEDGAGNVLPDERLVDADKQIDNKGYDDALRDLARIVPADFGKYEYLVHYTIGRAAEKRESSGDLAYINRLKLKTADEVNEKLCERARNNEDYQLAKKSFRKSIKLNPGFSPAYQQLAECLSAEGRFAEAFALADLLVMRVPRCATAYKLRGGLHVELKRHQEALTDFETAAELGPNDPQTYRAIGEACDKLGENGKAIEAYETSIRLDPTDCVCHFKLGFAYRRMGKFGPAIACFEEAKKFFVDTDILDAAIAECRAQMK